MSLLIVGLEMRFKPQRDIDGDDGLFTLPEGVQPILHLQTEGLKILEVAAGKVGAVGQSGDTLRTLMGVYPVGAEVSPTRFKKPPREGRRPWRPGRGTPAVFEASISGHRTAYSLRDRTFVRSVFLDADIDGGRRTIIAAAEDPTPIEGELTEEEVAHLLTSGHADLVAAYPPGYLVNVIAGDSTFNVDNLSLQVPSPAATAEDVQRLQEATTEAPAPA